MEGREKSVIRANYMRIADDLIANEDFYIALRQNKIFTDGMIANLKEEKTPRNEIYKMLGLLEKRGPDAFGKFIKVLEIAHPWLAEKLKADYQRRVEDSTIEDVPRQDYTAYSDERSSNTPRNPDLSMTVSVCPENTIRKKKANLSHSISLNQIHKNVEEHYSNRESQTPRGPRYTQEVENTDTTDIKYKQDLNIPRTFADKCISPIQIVLSKPSAPIEAKDPNLNPSLLQNHSMDYDKAVDIDDSINSISRRQVFADNKKACKDMTDDFIGKAKIRDDDKVDEISVMSNFKDSDNEEKQTARDISYTKYDSMQRFLTQKTSSIDVPNLAKEVCNDEVPEHDSDPEIDEDNYQKKRIHYMLQGLLMPNQDSPEQDKYQSNSMYADSVTLDMIEDDVHSLKTKHTNLQESHAKCFEYVDTKDRKKALHICVKIQKDELIEIKDELLEERKKVDGMAKDMYIQMKNIEKLKETLKNKICDNTILQNKLSELEKSSLELHKRNQDLEMSLKTKQESAVDVGQRTVEDKPPLATVVKVKKTRRLTRDRDVSPRKSFFPDSSRHTLIFPTEMYPNPKGRTSGIFSPRITKATGRKIYQPK